MRASARLLLSSVARGRGATAAAAGNLSGNGGFLESAIALRPSMLNLLNVSSVASPSSSSSSSLSPPSSSLLLRSFSASPSSRFSSDASAGSGGKVVEITTDDAFTAALAATKSSSSSSSPSPSPSPLAVFQFTAAWCGPCRAISPIVESMAGSSSNVSFYKVDVDEEGVTKSCADENISAVPTFKFAKGGRIVEEATVRGADLAALKTAIEELGG